MAVRLVTVTVAAAFAVGCGLSVVGAADGVNGDAGANPENAAGLDGGEPRDRDATGTTDAPEAPVPLDPMALCGRPSVYVDDFGDGALGPEWRLLPSGGSIAKTGGRLVITNVAGAAAVAESTFAVNLDEDRIRVEVPVAPTAGTAAFIAARRDATHEITMTALGNTLRVRVIDGGAPDEITIPYDPVAQRWWQIVEGGGSVRVETSPDAVAWSTHQTIATPAFARVAFLSLGASGASGGVATFDRLNAGRPRAPWCKASTFSDDFNDSTTGIEWTTVTQGACSFTEQNGEVRFTMTGQGTSLCAYSSAAALDLRESGVFVQVPSITNFFAPVRFFLRVVDASGRAAAIGFAGSGDLFTTATGLAPAATTYSSGNDTWWRVRESGGSLVWESSTNGSAWTEKRRVALPFAVDAVRVMIGVETAAAMGGSISIGTPRFNKN